MKRLELLSIIGSVVGVGIALGAVIVGSNANLHVELRTEMQELRTEVRTEMQELRAEVRTEMQELRTEVRTDIRSLDSRLSSVEQRLARAEGLLEGLRDAVVAHGAGDPEVLDGRRESRRRDGLRRTPALRDGVVAGRISLALPPGRTTAPRTPSRPPLHDVYPEVLDVQNDTEMVSSAVARDVGTLPHSDALHQRRPAHVLSASRGVCAGVVSPLGNPVGVATNRPVRSAATCEGAAGVQRPGLASLFAAPWAWFDPRRGRDESAQSTGDGA